MRRPLEQRLARLARTPNELGEAFRTRGADVLARRPDLSNWSATEIVCALRDGEPAGMYRLSGTVTGLIDALPADVLLVPVDGVPFGLYAVSAGDPRSDRQTLAIAPVIEGGQPIPAGIRRGQHPNPPM